jgi:hypothetical protein
MRVSIVFEILCPRPINRNLFSEVIVHERGVQILFVVKWSLAVIRIFFIPIDFTKYLHIGMFSERKKTPYWFVPLI